MDSVVAGLQHGQPASESPEEEESQNLQQVQLKVIHVLRCAFSVDAKFVIVFRSKQMFHTGFVESWTVIYAARIQAILH